MGSFGGSGGVGRKKNKSSSLCSRWLIGEGLSLTRRTERGILHAPMAMALVLFTVSGVGILGTLRHWRSLVEHQLRLNRCVGQEALELKRILQSLEISNQEIRRLRAFGLASQGTAQGEVVRQEHLLAQWRLRQHHWLRPGYCGNSDDIRDPLPSLILRRDPPDLLGPNILKELEVPSKETDETGETDEAHDPLVFTIQASHPPRSAAARVKKSRADRKYLGWEAKWVAPKI